MDAESALSEELQAQVHQLQRDLVDARENVQAHAATIAASAQKDVSVTYGVGDGTGNLFVHGSWEAIDRVRQKDHLIRGLQDLITRYRNRIRYLEQADVNEELMQHAAQRFREMEVRREEDVKAIAGLIAFIEKGSSGGTREELLATAKERLEVVLPGQM